MYSISQIFKKIAFRAVSSRRQLHLSDLRSLWPWPSPLLAPSRRRPRGSAAAVQPAALLRCRGVQKRWGADHWWIIDHWSLPSHLIWRPRGLAHCHQRLVLHRDLLLGKKRNKRYMVIANEAKALSLPAFLVMQSFSLGCKTVHFQISWPEVISLCEERCHQTTLCILHSSKFTCSSNENKTKDTFPSTTISSLIRTLFRDGRSPCGRPCQQFIM